MSLVKWKTRVSTCKIVLMCSVSSWYIMSSLPLFSTSIGGELIIKNLGRNGFRVTRKCPLISAPSCTVNIPLTKQKDRLNEIILRGLHNV